MEKGHGIVSIDDYISVFPKDIQKKLTELRWLIRRSAPDAIERISYRMPAFYLNGNLLYFAAHKKHIGFYPTASGVASFRDGLSKYKISKGAIQLPTDSPLPKKLIARIVRFRVDENKKRGTK